ncbi:hypothetical protein CerSpe_149230 [Prunus speciosa]
MGLGRESISADGRRTSRNTLQPIRKSLPVLKVNPEEMSIPKENAGSSENAEENRGYYVRAKVGKTVVPRVSNNARSHLCCGIEGQAISNTRALPRISERLLEERDEAMKQEELPSIDDDCYQLEVSDYVDEIYLYYWVSEAQNPPLENFMLIQADITPYMRGILVNWLIEVHFKFELMQETLLMVTLLDQYLSQVAIKKDEMQLVGLTAQSWHQNTRIFGILGSKN